MLSLDCPFGFIISLSNIRKKERKKEKEMATVPKHNCCTFAVPVSKAFMFYICWRNMVLVFVLTCEDFLRMVDHSFPACGFSFFLFFFVSGD